MKSSRSLFWSLLAPIAACAGDPALGGGSSPAPAHGIGLAPEPRRVATEAVIPEHIEACEQIRRDTVRVMAHSTEYDRLFEENRDRLAVFGRCQHTPGGLWAILLDDLTPIVRDMGATHRLDGHWALVHADANGENRTQRSPALPSVGRDAGDEPRNFVAGHPTSLRIHDPIFFDYDHAGEPEVVIVTDEETIDYGSQTRGRVWSLVGDGIEPYARAREIVVADARDVDSDGRPDLLTRGPYTGEWGDFCARHNTAVVGPTMLAHSLPDGSFSFSDETVLNAARETCPSDPDPMVVVDGSGAVDNASTARNVACARIRGMSVARVQAAVRSQCRRGSRARGRCVQGCNDVGLLLRWAEARPPVQLPPATPRRR